MLTDLDSSHIGWFLSRGELKTEHKNQGNVSLVLHRFWSEDE